MIDLDTDVEGPVGPFREMFAELRPDRAMPLDRVYAPAVVFEDPLHRVEGLPALRAYFDRLNANLKVATFTFGDGLAGPGEVMLPWVMRLELRRGPRRPIVVSGLSHLRFGDRVTYQRDYFDAGAMIYENVPVLGAVVRWIKARV